MDKQYVKIGGQEIEALNIFGRVSDTDFDGRSSKSITLTMDYAQAAALFVDGLEWSIIQRQSEEQPVVNSAGEIQYNADGSVQTETQIIEQEWDNSDYCVAGPITDNRDGTLTCKMGKKTASDMLAELEAIYDEL